MWKPKEQKFKNIMQKGISFPFAWCSWIFDLTYDGQNTTIKNFTNEPFPSERYRTKDWHIPIVLLHLYIYGINTVIYQATKEWPSFIQEYI